ncbi:MAG: ribonuclease R [Fervidobacterium sp.]|uniref:Ribonuclease R n=2 Tax=Fervidobacterium gondwanense TaxID=44754 RepID=A0A1M7SY19_FERGO|nr:ribonuclease R [Fervidobacterium gondwanense]UXF01033.1 ribonuclease R [Fervidobacterium riparium]SHN63350.1 RNAse R [Fervidobacterium gondwanense DSM 13020]
MPKKNELKKFFKSEEYTPMTFKELCRYFGLNDDKEKQLLKEQLEELTESGFIFKRDDGRYAITKGNLFTGTIEFTRSGNLTFVLTDDGQEIAVPIEKTNLAMHKDKVQVQIVGKWYELPEGRVVRILERGIKQFVGVFQTRGQFSFVIPDDPKLPYEFAVPVEEINGAKPGMKVVAEITRYPSVKRSPEAKIIEVLGKVEDPATDFPTVVVKHNLPVQFPEEVLKEVAELPDNVRPEDIEGRWDFRDEIIVTIDGPDAKDFDDAVQVKKLPNGNYLLGVHIADVAHYVKPGTALDQEAYNRATSVYLADRVIPMLPFKLSNGLCSLVQGEDRLVMSLLMEIDRDGDVVNYKVGNGVIRSYRRLVYDDVNAFLEDKPEGDKLKDLAEHIYLMKELKDVLRENRRRRGAILDIEGDEVKIVLDEQGHAVDIVPRKRGESEVIIEEFMIKANETVAEIFHNADIPFLYRIHEEPDFDTLLQLKNYLSAIGIKMKLPQRVHPRVLQELLEKTKDHPLRSSIQRLLVRSMKRAVYSPGNVGHFGLASEAYTHFTSPIRRYPDLIVHRLLKLYLEKGGAIQKKEMKKLEKYLAKAAVHCSKRERVADEAEWDYDALKKIDYISKRIGEIYDVVVTSVTKFGMFVEIPDKYISGLIHVSTLDDYYYYDDVKSMLVGKHTGTVYRIGDMLKAKVVRADKIRMEINFEIPTDEELRMLESNAKSNRGKKSEQIEKKGKKSKKKVKTEDVEQTYELREKSGVKNGSRKDKRRSRKAKK